MLKNLIVVFVIGLCMYVGDAHPDRLVKKITFNEVNDLPTVLSYHIHCLFVNSDTSRIQKALKLHSDFQQQFNLTQTPLCTSTFDEKRLCMFDFELIPDFDSPFVSGNWAVFVPIGWYSTTVQWVMQNRGDLDIFIHPNSGAEVSDHKLWALWGGNVWPINFSAFSNQTIAK